MTVSSLFFQALSFFLFLTIAVISALHRQESNSCMDQKGQQPGF